MSNLDNQPDINHGRSRAATIGICALIFIAVMIAGPLITPGINAPVVTGALRQSASSAAPPTQSTSYPRPISWSQATADSNLPLRTSKTSVVDDHAWTRDLYVSPRALRMSAPAPGRNGQAHEVWLDPTTLVMLHRNETYSVHITRPTRTVAVLGCGEALTGVHSVVTPPTGWVKLHSGYLPAANHNPALCDS